MTFNSSLVGMVQSRAVSAIDFDTYGINIAGYHTQGKFAEAIAADATLVFPNIFDYDRALTDAEMKQNYDFDVKTFSLIGK